MTIGPLLLAVGMLGMGQIQAGEDYVTAVLPAVVVFGLGLSLVVAPVTATVLAAADASHAGIASGVNNAVARSASLVAVAALPAIAGLSGDDLSSPAAVADGFGMAMMVTAALAAAGGVLAWATIRSDVLETAPGECRQELDRVPPRHCAVDGTPVSSVGRERERVVA